MIAVIAGLAAVALIITGILFIPKLFNGGEEDNVVTGGGNGNTTTSGDGSGSSSGVISETIQLPQQPYPAVVMEIVTTLATQQYVTARLYLDALIEIELNEDTEAEYMTLLDETIEQFALAEQYSAQAVAAAELVQYCIDSGINLSNMSYIPTQGGIMADPLAYHPDAGKSETQLLAADPSRMTDKELKQWAKEIEDLAENLPTQGGIAKTLGEQLGVDARTAAQMLRDAYLIIGGEAEKDAAFYNRMMNYALATKTGCKVAVTIGAAVASGGATTLLQGAALVATSADVIAEVAVTGCTIVLGEDHGLTKLYSGVQDYTAPVSAVLGLVALDFSKVGKLSEMSISGVRALLASEAGAQILGGVSYFGGQLQDLFADDRFMGFSRDTAMDLATDPGSQMALGFVYGVKDLLTGADGKVDPNKLREFNEALKNANLPPIPESATKDPPAPKPALEKAKETAPKVPPKSVDDYINELLDWMVEYGIITAEQADKYRPGGGAVAIDIEGTYVGTYVYNLAGTGNVKIDATLIDETTNMYAVVVYLSAPRDGWTEETYSTTGIAFFDESTGLVTYSAPVNEILHLDLSFDGAALFGTIVGSNESLTVEITFSAIKQ